MFLCAVLLFPSVMNGKILLQFGSQNKKTQGAEMQLTLTINEKEIDYYYKTLKFGVFVSVPKLTNT